MQRTTDAKPETSNTSKSSKTTLPLASYAKPEPRRAQPERRTDGQRATLGDRRLASMRAIRSLLRI